MLSNSATEYNVDAQVILAELDRSLRSPAIGDQCEAIVRVPQLFQRYPFPILINSASLKLSEVYRHGSNFLRILILEVMKESEKHLDKILNIEEFVRHLFAVSYANDPQARSITLQTLGSIARIVANNHNIHDFIRKSLDSVDELEVNSAIEASVKFAIQSKDFAQNIYPKIIAMIEGLATSMSIKVRLLEVINNLHHNIAISEDARKKLICFLAKYPEKNFVCENLHTMTSIAAASITHIPEQVKLLLEYYTNDPRNAVKLSVLDDLKFLARESAHLWEQASVTKFVDLIFANLEQNNLYLTQNSVEHKELRLLCKALGVLSEFFASPAIFIDDSLFSKKHIVKIVDFCTQIIYQTSTRALFAEELQIDLVSNCFSILTNICSHVNSKIYETDVLKETCCAYESFFLSKLISDLDHHRGGNQTALRTILRSMVTLCRTHPPTSPAIVQVTEALRFVFLRCKLNSPLMELFCEAICALALVVRANKSLTPTDILDLLKGRQSKKKVMINSRINIKFYVIFFQLKIGSVISAKETQILLNGMVKCNYWVCYKIVREAMRFGHHNFAFTLLNHIKPGTEPIENTYFWINSLAKITKAESLLSQDEVVPLKEADLLANENLSDNKFEQQLLSAISTYTEGLTHLKASVSSSKPMRFQCEFIKLRLKYLQSHQHFRQCCQLLQSSPPPSTAPSGLSQNAAFADDSIRYGRIVSSMHKCAQEFRALAVNYSLLFQSSFDADPNTLTNIQLLQHSCTILAELIENLFRGSHRLNSLQVPSHNMKGGKQMELGVVEHQELEDLCSTISELVQSDQLLCLSRVDPKQASSSEQPRLLAVFTNQIGMLLRISKRILVTPLSFPRFFFQAVQSTSIKLELGSQSRNKEKDKVTIHQNIQFVLNVEGVVSKKQAGLQPIDMFSRRAMYSHSRSMSATVIGRNQSLAIAPEPKVFRKVSKILLTLTTTPAMGDTPLHQMHSVVVPTHDYFQTQFLLTLPTVGYFTITVETSIIDENEAQWKSGPVQSISARVIEDYRPL